MYLASEGNFYDVGDGKVSNSGNNVTDCKYHLTIVRSDTDKNISVPFLYLVSGKNINNYALSEAKLVYIHGAPAG